MIVGGREKGVTFYSDASYKEIRNKYILHYYDQLIFPRNLTACMDKTFFLIMSCHKRKIKNIIVRRRVAKLNNY